MFAWNTLAVVPISRSRPSVRGTVRFTNNFDHRTPHATQRPQNGISSRERERSLAKCSTYHRHYRNRGDRARGYWRNNHRVTITWLAIFCESPPPPRSVIPPPWFIIDSWLTLSLLGKCIHQVVYTGWPTCRSLSISLSLSLSPLPWQNEIPRVDEPSFHRAAVSAFQWKFASRLSFHGGGSPASRNPLADGWVFYLLTAFRGVSLEG